jgi:hypothetical protein
MEYFLGMRDDDTLRVLRLVVTVVFIAVWDLVMALATRDTARIVVFALSAPLSLAFGEFFEWFARAQMHLIDANPHFIKPGRGGKRRHTPIDVEGASTSLMDDDTARASVVGEALVESAIAGGGFV